MVCKCLVAASILSVLLLSGACTRKDSAPQSAATEFTFAGGKLKDGKITVDPGIKVAQDPKTKNVILRRANGTGITIACSCILEAGGSCFPDSTPIGPDTTVVVCVSTGCGPGGEPFCLMETDDPGGGGTSPFNFKALVKASASKASQ